MSETVEIGKQGGVLGRGVASWTTNEDAAKTVDFRGFIQEPLGRVILAVRNGSAVVDLVARYGHVRKLTALATIPTGVACVLTATGDTVTSAAHGLVVGDAITFSGTGGGVVAGTVYYVTAVSDVNTFQFSAARGGTTFNITPDGTNAYTIAEEQMAMGTFTVEKFTAGTSIALIGGLEEVVIEGVHSPFRVTLTKSAATAAIFTAYVELRRG